MGLYNTVLNRSDYNVLDVMTVCVTHRLIIGLEPTSSQPKRISNVAEFAKRLKPP